MPFGGLGSSGPKPACAVADDAEVAALLTGEYAPDDLRGTSAEAQAADTEESRAKAKKQVVGDLEPFRGLTMIKEGMKVPVRDGRA
jgi:hypothetical protein